LPRRFAYIDTLRSRAHFGLGEYKEAAAVAKDAFFASKAVKSEFNIARIARIYKQLRESNKRSSDITELGQEIKKTHPQFVPDFK
jgi:hypothetical protein